MDAHSSILGPALIRFENNMCAIRDTVSNWYTDPFSHANCKSFTVSLTHSFVDDESNDVFVALANSIDYPDSKSNVFAYAEFYADIQPVSNE